MRHAIVWLGAVTGWLSGVPAAACEARDAKADESPLETRRPVRGEEVRLTTGFGMRRYPLIYELRLHAGVDWAAPHGSPVVAAAAGRVLSTTTSGEFGNTIFIDHGAGWQTAYAHLSAVDVGADDCVMFGTIIGKVGSTGIASGPVLHFELWQDGRPIDPMSLPAKRARPMIDDK